MEADIEESKRDRLTLHGGQRELRELILANHREVLEAIARGSKETAAAERAIVLRVESTEDRVRSWEDKVIGASWAAKVLPAGVASAVTAIIAWLLSKGRFE